eukprot:TRINITY_DN631_c0_g1_i10.p1 TRINITY_DN631_c0_g1~~TRINITY_DN631_c0_g1_i10.p1  ORF type:complete len:193 (+),score=50.60 TRINITY_DN631_c0_g1_i10:67-645(+)
MCIRDRYQRRVHGESVKMKKSGLIKPEKISCELLTLTYGAIVSQIVQDYENVHEVNQKLDEFGFNMGKRLIDEFLAKSAKETCLNFRDVAETIAKSALPMFLGVPADVTNFNEKDNSFSLELKDNPLNDYVELPEALSGLNYSSIIAGAIRGALEMLQYRAKVEVVKDTLKGDDKNEIRVELKEIISLKLDE